MRYHHRLIIEPFQKEDVETLASLRVLVGPKTWHKQFK